MRPIAANPSQVVEEIPGTRLEGLAGRKPPAKKLSPSQAISRAQTTHCRSQETQVGHRRIQNELIRLHEVSFSTSTIHKTLHHLGKPVLNKKRAFRKMVNRYSGRYPASVFKWTSARLLLACISTRPLTTARATRSCAYIRAERLPIRWSSWMR